MFMQAGFAFMEAGAVRSKNAVNILKNLLDTWFIYPVASHWAWHPQGWLKRTAFKDYTEGGVVLILGGMCTRLDAALMGPRISRFHVKTSEPHDFRGHSVAVGVCAGSDVFPSWAALVVGVEAGFTFLCLHFLLLRLNGQACQGCQLVLES
ncbi:unnamed protein product [Darwinula stevensoni]|uniref:Ammonium transporter AmtB-like domain-containing protein n=1 Tax=Darwinula stevensoni TaxID=69355 RepID=A0A7R8X939_9CRUS|nr:unnamed protein product [Darwinula stevensoni]CAG0890719.1 unnamed protein product [Darwinula stevensoni]